MSDKSVMLKIYDYIMKYLRDYLSFDRKNNIPYNQCNISLINL